MTFLNGITLLLIYQLVGEIATHVLQLPVPGPVLGMMLLFLTLVMLGSVPPSVDSAANALLDRFSLLFVPAGVGVMVHFDLLAKQWLPIAVTLVLSTLLTLTGTAVMMTIARRFLSNRLPNDV